MSWMPFIKLFSPGPSGLMPMLTPEKLLCYSEATQHLILGVHHLLYCKLPHDIFDLGQLNKYFAVHLHYAVAVNGIQAVAVIRRANQ
jgi:hypothetical protein